MIVVVVHVGSVNIYVAAAAVEALRKKERRGQKRMKLRLAESAFLSLTPPYPPLKANVLFCTTKFTTGNCT